MAARTIFDCGTLTVLDYRCTAGPGDEAFVELHGGFDLAYVRRGSFGYRTGGVTHELVAGSVLVGHPGDEYVCTHDHVQGDECLSFQLSPAVVDAVGARHETWRSGSLPPLPELMVIGELAQAAVHGDSDVGVDEVGMLLAARLVDAVSGRRRSVAGAVARDRRRAVETALWMDAHSHEPLDLEDAAREAGISAYHFLRLFARVLGVTPHQYLVRSRLRHRRTAAAEDDRSITTSPSTSASAISPTSFAPFHRAPGVSPRRFRRTATKGRPRALFDKRLAALPLA
jgi:AraC-like DNA-binding protein